MFYQLFSYFPARSRENPISVWNYDSMQSIRPSPDDIEIEQASVLTVKARGGRLRLPTAAYDGAAFLAKLPSFGNCRAPATSGGATEIIM